MTMEKPVRPKLPAQDLHTVPVKFYLTDAEHARLTREAHARGLGLSAYVRACLLAGIKQQAAA